MTMLPIVCTRVYKCTALLCRLLSQARSNVFIDESFLDGGSSAGSAIASGAEEMSGSPVLSRARQRQQRMGPPTAWADPQHTATRDIDLTKSIKEARTVLQVFSLVQLQSTDLNPIHISAAMTRLVSLVALRRSVVDPGDRSVTDDIQISVNASLELLTVAAKAQLTTFQPRQLSNCSWAAAKLISAGIACDAPTRALASVLLAEAALPGRLKGIQPGEISLLAWSAHTLKIVNQDLLAAVESAALEAASFSPGTLSFRSFKDHELVNLLLPFASWLPHSPSSGGYPDDGIVSKVCSAVVHEGRLNSMEARHVRSLAYVCAAVHKDFEFSSQLMARMKSVIDQLSPLLLPGLLQSLLLLNCRSHSLALILEVMQRIAAAAQIQPPLYQPVSGGRFYSSQVSAHILRPLLPTLWKETIQAQGTPGDDSDQAFLIAVQSFTADISPAIIQGGRALDAALLLLLQVASAEDASTSSDRLIMLAKLLVSTHSALAALPIDVIHNLVIYMDRFVTLTRHKADAEAVVKVFTFALRTVCLSRMAEFHPADRSEVLKCLMLSAE